MCLCHISLAGVFNQKGQALPALFDYSYYTGVHLINYAGCYEDQQFTAGVAFAA